MCEGHMSAGILDDVDVSDASKAAGGRESTKDSTGVSSKYAKVAAELKAKLAKLKQVALKTKVPGAMQKLDMIEQKFAHTAQLPVYGETEEVAAILKDMLSDLENRLKVYDQVDSAAEKLVEDTQAKMVQWQTELVALSNAADKAKEKQMSAQLEREKLNGDKKVVLEIYACTSSVECMFCCREQLSGYWTTLDFLFSVSSSSRIFLLFFRFSSGGRLNIQGGEGCIQTFGPSLPKGDLRDHHD